MWKIIKPLCRARLIFSQIEKNKRLNKYRVENVKINNGNANGRKECVKLRLFEGE